MTTGLSGPTLTLDPGDEHDFPQDEALRLITAGYAVPVSDVQLEHAVPAPVIERREDAAWEPRRKKKRRR